MTMIKSGPLPLILYEGETLWSSNDNDTYVNVSIDADQLSESNDTSCNLSESMDQSSVFNKSVDLEYNQVKELSSPLTNIIIKPQKNLKTCNDSDDSVNKTDENSFEENSYKSNVSKRKLQRLDYEIEETTYKLSEIMKCDNKEDIEKLPASDDNYRIKKESTTGEFHDNTAETVSNQPLRFVSNEVIHKEISCEEYLRPDDDESITLSSIDEIRETIPQCEMVEDMNVDIVTRVSDSQKLSFIDEFQRKGFDEHFDCRSGESIGQKTFKNEKSLIVSSADDLVHLDQQPVLTCCQNNISSGENFEKQQTNVKLNGEENVGSDDQAAQSSFYQLFGHFYKTDDESKSDMHDLSTPDISDLSTNVSVNINLQKIDFSEDFSKESVESIAKEIDAKLFDAMENDKVDVFDIFAQSEEANQATTADIIDISFDKDPKEADDKDELFKRTDENVVQQNDVNKSGKEKIDSFGEAVTSEEAIQIITEEINNVGKDSEETDDSGELFKRTDENVVQQNDVNKLGKEKIYSFGESVTSEEAIQIITKEMNNVGKDSEETDDSGELFERTTDAENVVKQIDSVTSDNIEDKIDASGESSTSEEVTQSTTEKIFDVPLGKELQEADDSDETFKRTTGTKNIAEETDSDTSTNITVEENRIETSGESPTSEEGTQSTIEEIVGVPLDNDLLEADDSDDIFKKANENFVKQIDIAMFENIEKDSVDSADGLASRRVIMGNTSEDKMNNSDQLEVVEDLHQNKENEEITDFQVKDLVQIWYEDLVQNDSEASRSNKYLDISAKKEPEECDVGDRFSDNAMEQFHFLKSADKNDIQLEFASNTEVGFQNKDDAVEMTDPELLENKSKIRDSKGRNMKIFNQMYSADPSVDEDEDSISVEVNSLSNDSLSFSTEKIIFNEFQEIYESELKKADALEKALKKLEEKTNLESQNLLTDYFIKNQILNKVHTTSDSLQRQQFERFVKKLVIDRQKKDEMHNTFRREGPQPSLNLENKLPTVGRQRCEEFHHSDNQGLCTTTPTTRDSKNIFPWSEKLCPGEDHEDSNWYFEQFDDPDFVREFESIKFSNNDPTSETTTSVFDVREMNRKKTNTKKFPRERIRFKNDPSSETSTYTDKMVISSLNLNKTNLNWRRKSVQPNTQARFEEECESSMGKEGGGVVSDKDKFVSPEPLSSELFTQVNIDLQNTQSSFSEDRRLPIINEALKSRNEEKTSPRKKIKIYGNSDYQVFMQELSSGPTSSTVSWPKSDEPYLKSDKLQSEHFQKQNKMPSEGLDITFYQDYDQFYNSNNNMDSSSIQRRKTVTNDKIIDYDEPFNEALAVAGGGETSSMTIDGFANTQSADDDPVVEMHTLNEGRREIFTDTDLSVELSVNLFSKTEQSMDMHVDTECIGRPAETPSEFDEMIEINDFPDGDKGDSLFKSLISKVKKNSDEVSLSLMTMKETIRESKLVKGINSAWRALQQSVHRVSL